MKIIRTIATICLVLIALEGIGFIAFLNTPDASDILIFGACVLDAFFWLVAFLLIYMPLAIQEVMNKRINRLKSLTYEAYEEGRQYQEYKSNIHLEQKAEHHTYIKWKEKVALNHQSEL